MTMELVLILGIVLTATGILVGAALVLIGTACEVFAVWPVQIEMELPGAEPTP
jgi:hypothetical protein